ncbi:hypothetical protein A9G24_06040 [Gilliamella sp. App6-5]|uniref:hypothetical protein n=1 Tax=Gilliamella sp. App6-5 TaxID=3120232 RepID=UPI00080E22DD|nr:hypothetical protein [Gilliamella apicola]OCG14925.1 hypothetical protein A9G24_06040 [Gilliamella apicola]
MNKPDFNHQLNELIAMLKSKGFVIKGCNDQQLVQLERQYGQLPEYYKIFLSKLGVNAGDFMLGTAVLFHEIADINQGTLVLMAENNISIPNNLYAFLLHQGYSSLFFMDRHDDPMVYCYTEGDVIKNLNYRFSQCISAEIALYKTYQTE